MKMFAKTSEFKDINRSQMPISQMKGFVGEKDLGVGKV